MARPSCESSEGRLHAARARTTASLRKWRGRWDLSPRRRSACRAVDAATCPPRRNDERRLRAAFRLPSFLASALPPSRVEAQDVPEPLRRHRPLAPLLQYPDEALAGGVVGRALASVSERRSRNRPDLDGWAGLDRVDNLLPGETSDPGYVLVHVIEIPAYVIEIDYVRL